MTAYTRLEERFAKASRLGDALGILGWDKDTTMPLGAGSARGETLATLSVMAHELLAGSETSDLLGAAEADVSGLDPWQSANLREMRRQHVHATAVPADLVAGASRASTDCELRWRQARTDNDFAGLRPFLAEVLRTQREIGQAKGQVLGLAPYDALLDQYDPGSTQSLVNPIFAELRAALPELIGTAIETQASKPAPIPLEGPFPIDKQKALGEALVATVGFDFERGRLDISAHPFCGGATDDVRLTTRYDEADFASALMGVLHETGHALYEQGRPRDYLSQPVGQARGMSLHESQSLLIEMQICRSDAFLEFLAPKLQTAFGPHPSLTAANLGRLSRRVERSLIRVDADEVTYPAHVILRYGIERELIAGSLSLADLPTAFNDGMRQLVGIDVPDDRNGCLQDVHWPAGLFGYFPTYSLGAIISAQLAAAATKAVPGLWTQIAEGSFLQLVDWLRQTVHGPASSSSTPEIIRNATGDGINSAIYLAHLRKRYAGQ